MRKTGLFGYDSRVNIEWPTAKDLMDMLKNIPTKITDLKYQKSTWNAGTRFGALQVTLSNGISSPVFNCKDEGQNMQSVPVRDYSLVKRIIGTKQGIALRCLIFSKKDGSQIAKVETKAGYSYGTEFVIADSEEIIGIYGYKDDLRYYQLGFLVWTPPRF